MNNCFIEYSKLLHKYRKIFCKDVNHRKKILEDLRYELKKINCRANGNILQLRISGVNVQSLKLYTDAAACGAFIEKIIKDFENEGALENYLGYLEAFFGEYLLAPRGGILKPDEIEKLLNLVEQKFSLVSAISHLKVLDIYLIDRTHPSCDSFLLTYKNRRNGFTQDRLMLFSLSPCMDILECNRYFIFTHELGHILYNASIETGSNPPEFFEEIEFLLGLPAPGVGEIRDELFADIFAAALLHNTEYSCYNPFKTILPDSIFDFLELYFRMLTYKLDRENRQVLSGFEPSALN